MKIIIVDDDDDENKGNGSGDIKLYIGRVLRRR